MKPHFISVAALWFCFRLPSLMTTSTSTSTGTYTITLNEPWFDLVRNGTKTYEGRCYWNQTRLYKKGDQLRVVRLVKKGVHSTTDAAAASNVNDAYLIEIEDILLFATFRQALEALGLKETLPGIATLEEGVQVYLQFYRLETQLAHGVCMLKVKRIHPTLPLTTTKEK